MRLFLHTVVALSLSSISIAGQDVPPARHDPPNTQTVVVRGCITGRNLRASQSGTLGPAGATYRLTGSKAMLVMLKEHDGHDDAITGTVRVSDKSKMKVGKEAKSGKTRVYGSASSEDQTMATLPDPPTVNVDAIEHFDAPCAKR